MLKFFTETTARAKKLNQIRTSLRFGRLSSKNEKVNYELRTTNYELTIWPIGRIVTFLFSITSAFLLSGCLYQNPPSQPACQIDTWLLGDWIAQEKNGKTFEAIVTPQDNTHYHVTVYNQDQNLSSKSTETAKGSVTPVLESSGMPYTFRALRSEAPCPSSASATLKKGSHGTCHPYEFEGWISRVENIKFLTLRSLSCDEHNGKYIFLHYELLKRAKAPIDGVSAIRIRTTEPQLEESARNLDSYHLRQEISKRLKEGCLLLPGGTVWTKER